MELLCAALMVTVPPSELEVSDDMEVDADDLDSGRKKLLRWSELDLDDKEIIDNRPKAVSGRPSENVLGEAERVSLYGSVNFSVS
jgi:hypothetical protein